MSQITERETVLEARISELEKSVSSRRARFHVFWLIGAGIVVVAIASYLEDSRPVIAKAANLNERAVPNLHVKNEIVVGPSGSDDYVKITPKEILLINKDEKYGGLSIRKVAGPRYEIVFSSAQGAEQKVQIDRDPSHPKGTITGFNSE